MKIKKFINAEVVERRGRMAQIKTNDGLTGLLPIDDLPGVHLLIYIERKE